jgi:25S rRNA (cytosine2870-C5)-methyltransferase
LCKNPKSVDAAYGKDRAKRLSTWDMSILHTANKHTYTTFIVGTMPVGKQGKAMASRSAAGSAKQHTARGKMGKRVARQPAPPPRQMHTEAPTSSEDEEDDEVQVDRVASRDGNGNGRDKGKGSSSRFHDDDDDDDDEDDDDSEEEDGDDVHDDEDRDHDDEEDDNADEDDEDETESHELATQNKKTKTTGFTDENAKWLKPKKASKQLLSSDDEEDDEDVDDDNDEDDDDDELLEIEEDAQQLDDELEIEREEADAEMKRTIADHTSIYHLPTAAELEKDVDRVVPPTEIRSHIESILEVLAEFKARREEGRSRQEYIDVLVIFLSELYGYLPELVEYFMTMFSPSECLEFIDASDKPRPLVVRTNTLKARRKDLAAALIKRGVSLDPLAGWSKVGLKIVESPVPVGATPEYLSGMYMLQSAASMCPVLALAPLPQEKVLDMSSAPGGKTSYIAQLMRNTGTIIANDLKPERQKATVANMHRLGVKNVITCANDGRKLGQMFKNRFDRILLDAPCSGLGVISRDPSVKVQRTIADVKQCAHLQKELLLAAIDALKYKSTTGGVMVYSTCSVSVYENEEVVQYALQKRDIQIIETGLDFGSTGFTRYQQKRFHPSMALTKRFYPHTVNMDGFFVCKIKKLSDKWPDSGIEGAEDPATEETDAISKSPTASATNALDDATGKGSTSVVQGAGKKKRTANADEKPISEIKKARVAAVPKVPQSSNKKRTNAKMTKPRRAKKEGATDV